MKAIQWILLTVLLAHCISKNTTMNDRITITGTALNGKDGALIKTQQGEVYYIEGLPNWDSVFNNQTVEATGVLLETTLSENNLQNEQREYKAGISGIKRSLIKATYKIRE